MRLLIASDLHFEFHRDGGVTLANEMAKSQPDVLVCPGDLTYALDLEDALLILLERFPCLVYTYGNHEFYEGSLAGVRERMKVFQEEVAGRAGLGTFHLLDNSVCEIEGRRFVGTTMWTRYFRGIERYERGMNDFQAIADARPGLYEENEQAMVFLSDTVQERDIVLTHHLPSPKSTPARFQRSPLNAFFVCNMEPLIEQRRPRLWVHGHTHDSCDYVVATTQVVCNPFGYAGHELNPAFRPDLIIEV